MARLCAEYFSLSFIRQFDGPRRLFSYNNDGTVAEKRDAKMQKLVYEYDADPNGRLKLVKRLLAGGGEAVWPRVRYYYDTQNANGRMAAVETGCAGTGAGR